MIYIADVSVVHVRDSSIRLVLQLLPCMLHHVLNTIKHVHLLTTVL
jgi:hypothetical protein